MSKLDKPTPKKSRTWILVLALIVAIYAFWILPAQLGPRNVRVDYQTAQPK